MTGVANLPAAARIWGTVSGTDGASVRLAGLAKLARLGDRIEIETAEGRLPGEIVAIDGTDMTALLMSPPKGLSAGQKAWLVPDAVLTPSGAWLGKILDAFGCTANGDPVGDAMPANDAPRASYPVRNAPATWPAADDRAGRAGHLSAALSWAAARRLRGIRGRKIPAHVGPRPRRFCRCGCCRPDW